MAITTIKTYTQADVDAMKRLNETTWQNKHFVPYFKSLGWIGEHYPDSRYVADSGWPDWTIVRDRIIYVELKAEGGRPTEKQREMMDKLTQAGGEVYLFYPRMWRKIEEILK